MTAMTDELDWVLLVVSDIAKSFRREECLAVLQELCRGECQFPATVEGIRLAIGHLNSPKPYPPDRLACRLLSNRQLVKSVRAKDLVDDCFNIGPSLPKGCRGLVLPTVPSAGRWSSGSAKTSPIRPPSPRISR